VTGNRAQDSRSDQPAACPLDRTIEGWILGISRVKLPGNACRGMQTRPTRSMEADLRIWIITVGEPLPTDPGSNRLWRSGLTAQLLADRGYDVTWWTSTFDHFRKVRRYRPAETRALSDRFRLIYLHGVDYHSNLSWRRIVNHVQLGRHFRGLAKEAQQPDLILCSLPTLELSREAVHYGRSHDVPVVIDVRDQWPDFIVDRMPRPLKPLAKLALLGMERDLRTACRGATAIIGNSPGLVQWGLEHSDPHRRPLSRYVPHGYPDTAPAEDELAAAAAGWDEQGVAAGDGVANICFFGTIRRTVLDFEPVLAAAEQLTGKVRFVICGVGDDLARLQRQAADLPGVILPGWVDAPRVHSLMNRSIAGLAPYRQTDSFMQSLPNKPIEYLSAGLPVLSSLEGFTRRLLAEHDCGYFYDDGDGASLIRVVGDLLADTQRRRQRAVAARELFLARFAADKVYGELADYLEELAAGTHPVA